MVLLKPDKETYGIGCDQNELVCIKNSLKICLNNASTLRISAEGVKIMTDMVNTIDKETWGIK